ncbi:hypothetical protein BJ138DRAFT_1020967, partial [Hygrophoropsis aurantiaca]
MYSDVRDVALEEGGPLYHRDVEKLDRQDDNAAARLFLAATLEYTSAQHPDRIGLIVYLFVFGELVDAYQNRHIGHKERIHMVLRAKFFLELWQAFLKVSHYAENRHFISHEAVDIMKYLVDGLISLVLVYRDHLGDTTHPLCPWLHSSEACEHVFAECRKLVKDFTFLDFIYMIPRLHVLIRTAVQQCHSTDPRARASGYAHTYFDNSGADLAQLAIFPTDEEIDECAALALGESEGLFALLGISPNDII